MARFCSECGENLTTDMSRCPRCGAKIYGREQVASRVVRRTIIGAGLLIILGTLGDWYYLSLNVGGSGGLGTLLGGVMSMLPAYTGLSTLYGMICCALALLMIIFAACHNKIFTLFGALSCVIITAVAINFAPEVTSFGAETHSDKESIVDLLNSPLLALMGDSGESLKQLTTAIEMLPNYMVVNIGDGLRMAFMASIAALLLAMFDALSAHLIHRKDNKESGTSVKNGIASEKTKKRVN